MELMSRAADRGTMDAYEKTKQIGKGSYGVVWLVKNKKDKKNVCDLFSFSLLLWDFNSIYYCVCFKKKVCSKANRFAQEQQTRHSIGSTRSPTPKTSQTSEHRLLQGLVRVGWHFAHRHVVLRRWRPLLEDKGAKRSANRRGSNSRMVRSNCNGSSSNFFSSFLCLDPKKRSNKKFIYHKKFLNIFKVYARESHFASRSQNAEHFPYPKQNHQSWRPGNCEVGYLFLC